MRYRLQELCEKITDGSHYSPKGEEIGYPMFSVKDMLEYGFDYSKCKKISQLDYQKMVESGCVPQKGDVLVAKDGSYLKQIFVCEETHEEAVLSSIAIFRPNTDFIESDYLCYLLKSPKVYNYIATNCVSGSALPRIVLKSFKDIELEVPSLNEQKKVVSILKPLDEKIKLNHKINNNLEQQAQAIFKSWFIDFEPFGSQQPSEWEISTLGRVSTMGAGGDKPKVVSSIKTDVCSYPIYSNGLSDEGLYGYTDTPKIFDESVTVSARGTIGFVCLRHIPYVPIVRLVTLVPNTGIISAKYLYLWLKQLHITGTGTTQQQLTVPDFQKTEILVPSTEAVSLFTTTVEPIFEKIWANQLENERLSQLRDALLSKLMFGANKY